MSTADEPKAVLYVKLIIAVADFAARPGASYAKSPAPVKGGGQGGTGRWAGRAAKGKGPP